MSFRYQPPLLVLVAAFMLAAFNGSFSDQGLTITEILLASVEFFSHVLMWTIAMAGVQNLRFPAYRTMGIDLMVYSSLSLLWLVLSATIVPHTGAIVLLAGYLIILAGVIHPRSVNPLACESVETVEEINEHIIDGEPRFPLETSGEAVTASLRRRCDIIAHSFELSSRESDILFLLAQGRTKPVIEEKLVLAPGTVKTHILHIYTKMSVHSQQEIISIVYGESDLSIA